MQALLIAVNTFSIEEAHVNTCLSQLSSSPFYIDIKREKIRKGDH